MVIRKQQTHAINILGLKYLPKAFADQLHFMCFIRDAYSLRVRKERQRNVCHQCQGERVD